MNSRTLKDLILVVPLFEEHIVLGKVNTKKKAAIGMPHPWSVPIGTNIDNVLSSAKRIARSVFRRDFSSRRFSHLASFEEDNRAHHVFLLELKERDLRKRMPSNYLFLAYDWPHVTDIPWAKTRPGTRAILEPLLLKAIEPKKAA